MSRKGETGSKGQNALGPRERPSSSRHPFRPFPSPLPSPAPPSPSPPHAYSKMKCARSLMAQCARSTPHLSTRILPSFLDDQVPPGESVTKSQSDPLRTMSTHAIIRHVSCVEQLLGKPSSVVAACSRSRLS